MAALAAVLPTPLINMHFLLSSLFVLCDNMLFCKRLLTSQVASTWVFRLYTISDLMMSCDESQTVIPKFIATIGVALVPVYDER